MERPPKRDRRDDETMVEYIEKIPPRRLAATDRGVEMLGIGRRQRPAGAAQSEKADRHHRRRVRRRHPHRFEIGYREGEAQTAAERRLRPADDPPPRV